MRRRRNPHPNLTLPLHRHRSPLTAHLSPFTLTLTSHAEEVTAACFAKKKGPRSITGKRSWQGRWFELTSTAVQYFEVGADAEVLLPLSHTLSHTP